MKFTPAVIISIGAIVLSISAISTVAVDNMTSTDLADLETRLNDQQGVIMQNRGLILNNTIFLENQFLFNNDVISWAGNVTAKIDGLASP